MELITVPLTFIILLLVFGSLTAAALPVLVGVFAVTGTMAVLRLLTELTEVSAFAMSLASLLGFALAVDFSLFVVTRFREELAGGREAAEAIRVTMRTTGRAMAFSALTVTLSLAALLLFPFMMLRSVALGGIAVTLLAAAGSLVVLPAALAVLGGRVDSLAVPGPWRAGRDRGPGGGWSRLAMAVMRRPLAVAVPTVALLAVLGAPFLDVRFGIFDDRLLPPEASAARAAEELRRDFDARDSISATTVVLPGLKVAGGDTTGSGGGAGTRAERTPGWTPTRGACRRWTACSGWTPSPAPTAGELLRPSPGPPERFTGPAGTWLAVSTAYEPYAVENSELARGLRAVPAPGRRRWAGRGPSWPTSGGASRTPCRWASPWSR
nr:hypothetical protein GCM10020093_071060 [Planobispora longispora]